MAFSDVFGVLTGWFSLPLFCAAGKAVSSARFASGTVAFLFRRQTSAFKPVFELPQHVNIIQNIGVRIVVYI